MAKTITTTAVVLRPWQDWARTIGIGALVGLVFWLVTILLTRYVVEPLACRQLGELTQCVNASAIAGNIANIIVGVVALLVMIRLRVVRPVIIAVGTIAVLWGLAGWTIGLSSLALLLSSMMLYGLAYALFSWITRAVQAWVAITLAIVVVIAIRTTLAFMVL